MLSCFLVSLPRTFAQDACDCEALFSFPALGNNKGEFKSKQQFNRSVKKPKIAEPLLLTHAELDLAGELNWNKVKREQSTDQQRSQNY